MAPERRVELSTGNNAFAALVPAPLSRRATTVRIFLFEFVTGGGFLDIAGRPMPEGSLLTEGEAMWRALYEDFSGLHAIEVHSTRDARLPAVDVGRVTRVSSHMRENFFSLAMNSDLTLIVAPEFDQHLHAYTAGIEAFGARLLSTNAHFISIAGNKTATSETLAKQGVSVPLGELLGDAVRIPTAFQLPVVLKANDGAGSMAEIIYSRDLPPQNGVMRIEQLVSGISCSISFFCQGGNSPIASPPMQQILSGDEHLTYLGGERLMDQNLVARATRIGRRALEALPPTIGYVGIDLVLGDNLSGDDDFVIEVNPRLTTSYIGLRAIADSNLAAAMIQIATGSPAKLDFSSRPVKFLADGTIL